MKVLYRLSIINVLKPSGYFVYHQVCYVRSLSFCPQSVSTCYVCVSEQTEIISIYRIK